MPNLHKKPQQKKQISQNNIAMPLIKLLEQQKTKCQQAHKFYQQLERSIPVEEQWKVLKVKKLATDLNGMIPGRTCPPTTILDSIIGALDEYLCALKSFTPDQIAAFMLGLGMRWFPFEYWGMRELLEYREQLERASAYYKKVESSIAKDEMWKIEKRDPSVCFPDLTPPSQLRPSFILKQAMEYADMAIQVLADRPF